MNKILNMLLFTLVVPWTWVYAQAADVDVAKYVEISKFINLYRAPAELEALVAEHAPLCQEQGNNVYEYEDIPYFHKGVAFDRVKNAKRLEKVIQVEVLDRLRVANKWVCKDQNGWFVLAEKVVSSKSLYPLTLEEIQQLVILSQVTGYCDYARFYKNSIQNIVRDEQGVLVIVDTEDRSFGLSCRESAIQIMTSMLQAFFYQAECAFPLTVQARQWLEQYRDELLFSKNLEFYPTLPHNPAYDDVQINYEQLLLEYDCFQSELKLEKLKCEYQALCNKIAPEKVL